MKKPIEWKFSECSVVLWNNRTHSILDEEQWYEYKFNATKEQIARFNKTLIEKSAFDSLMVDRDELLKKGLGLKAFLEHIFLDPQGFINYKGEYNKNYFDNEHLNFDKYLKG